MPGRQAGEDGKQTQSPVRAGCEGSIIEVSASSPAKVLPDGSGQAPAYLLAAENEGATGEEADQGLRPAPRGGETEAPAGNRTSSQVGIGIAEAKYMYAAADMGCRGMT